MNLPAAVATFCLLLLLFAVAVRVAVAAGRRGAPTCRTARITAVQTVHDAYEVSLVSSGDQGGSHTVLKQPYDEVRFRFRTAQGAEVLTLDRVDADSAGPMHPGDTKEVCYETGRPRLARLAVGTRTFDWRNTWDYWSTEILALAAAVTVTALAVGIWRSLKRQLPRPGG